MRSDSNNVKRAIIYVRVSTKEQVDEGNSLVTQEKICREYARKNGYEIVKVFIEQGESAKTADRTELQNLLRFCANNRNQIDTLIIYKVDRLSRSVHDYATIKYALRKCKVEVKSSSESFGEDSAGKFMENVMAVVAQFDNDVRSERCAGGMREAVREGRYVWGAPVGYINASVGGKANITQTEMAPLIRKSFELVGTGLYPVEDVWQMMVNEGLVKKGGKPIGRSYFHNILRNELYTGWINKFGERHKGLFEPIVSEELFKQVQKVLKNRGRRVEDYQTDNPDFPLRRFVLHPDGYKLTGSNAKGKYPKYHFTGASGLGTFDRDKLHLAFEAFMDSFGFEESKLARLKRFVKEDLDKATQSERKEMDKLQTRLKEIESTESALIQKNIKGVLSDEMLQKQLNILSIEAGKLESNLVAMKGNEINPEDVLEFVEEYLVQPSVLWRKAPSKSMLRLQKFQFPSGVCFDGVKFGTDEVSFVFKAKQAFLPVRSTLVDPIGFEPMTSSLQMRRSTN